MRKRLFIAALMGVIPALVFTIASFSSGEDWEWGTARAVFFLCILPFAISGFIGATVYERAQQNRPFEQISTSEKRIEETPNLPQTADDQNEPGQRLGEKNNLPEATNRQAESRLSGSITGAVLGGIVFVVVVFIACLIIYYVLGCQNGC